MKADHKNLSDGALRKLLNLGDPAGDGNEPTLEELTAMRRTVLNAIDTNPAARSWLSRPYATAATTVAVALIALALLLRAGPWGTVLQPETGSVTPAEPAPAAPIESTTAVVESLEALAAEPSADPAPTTAGTEASPQGMEPQTELQPAPRVAAVAELPVSTADEPTVAAVEESQGIVPPTVEREPRTVRFTAPGGTRIIWTLDPDFQLPVSEPDDRARGEL